MDSEVQNKAFQTLNGSLVFLIKVQDRLLVHFSQKNE